MFFSPGSVLYRVNKIRDEEGMRRFGRRVRQLRQEKGMTMEQLAFRAELEYSQISRIERGLINTTVSTILLLARTLSVRPAELLNFDEPEDEQSSASL